MANSFGRLALHTWTIDTTPLATALDAVRAAGYDAVELRRIDFTRCYDTGMSRAQVRDMIRDSGVKVGILGVEYGWLFAPGDESKRLFAVLRETCQDAVALGCDMLMCAPGQISAPLPEAIANLRIGADIVAEFGLRIAIEFNSQHAVLNRLEVLRALLAGAGKPNCGCLLDDYHITRSRDGPRAFEDVPGNEIFVFQYSDVPPRPVPDGIKGQPTASHPAWGSCSGARCSACWPRRATPATSATKRRTPSCGRTRLTTSPAKAAN